jgi:hypothetical protein
MGIGVRRLRHTTALALLLLALAFQPTVFPASTGPSWGTEEYGNFVRSLIFPNDLRVQERLRNIAPIQDSTHFAQNLRSVYDAASRLEYPRDEAEGTYFAPNWMSASEVLQYGRGDCKNHAILLVTLIEALYGNTYGYVPQDLVWIVGGSVQAPDGGTGGHVWVWLNMDRIRSVSQAAFNIVRDTPLTTGASNVPVGARPPWSNAIKWITFNLNSLADRIRSLFPLNIMQGDTFYVELEPTWRQSISAFYHKQYPYVEIHDQWNSYEYHKNPRVTPPGAGLLQLSSTFWRYGDTVSWFAKGLTPRGIISTMIQGSWGSVGFADVRADSNGDAGSSFTVGANIGGSGRFLVIDRTTNTFLTKDYTLAQSATTTKPITVSIEISDAYWTVGGARVTQAKLGQTVQARVVVRAIGGSVDGNAVVKVRKDRVAWPDSDHATGNLRIQLGKDQAVELILSFVADEKSSLTFRGFFIEVDFVSWGNRWTMPGEYPPRLRVV